MRRAAGYILVVLGGFLLTVAVLAQTYMPSHLLKMPLEADEKTRLEGTAQMAGVDGLEDYKIKILNHTAIDASASNDTSVVWVMTNCIVVDAPGVPDCVSADDPDYRLLSATVEMVASDRVTALGISSGPVMKNGIQPTEGIVNKFPFNSEKKTYPFWDSTLGRTVDAEYEREATVEGVEVYVYGVDVPSVEAEIAPGVQGTYTTTMTFYIEPRTGAVLNQVFSQERALPDGSPVFSLAAQMTPEQSKEIADKASSNVDRLHLMFSTVPVLGYIIGALCLAAGVLVLRQRRPARAAPIDSPAELVAARSS